MMYLNGKTAPSRIIFQPSICISSHIKMQELWLWTDENKLKNIFIGNSGEIKTLQSLKKKTRLSSLGHRNGSNVSMISPPPNVIVTSEYCKLPNVYCIKVFRACPLSNRFSSYLCQLLSVDCTLSRAVFPATSFLKGFNPVK